MRSVRFAKFLYRWHVMIPCVMMGCVTLAFYLLKLKEDLNYPVWFTVGLFGFNILLLLGSTILVQLTAAHARTLLKVNSVVLTFLLLVNPALAIGFSPQLMSVLWAVSIATFMLYASIYIEEARRTWIASGVPFYTSLLHVVVDAVSGVGAASLVPDLVFGFLMSVFYALFGWFLRALSSAREVPVLDEQNRAAVDGLLEAHGLTPREREVCCALLDGLTARQVGEKLFISEGTAKNHMKSAYRKLGVRSKMQLIHTVAERESSKMSLS